VSVELRPLATDDLDFAGAMLLAAFVPPLPGDPAEILARPEVRKYLDDWGRSGDRGFVASIDGVDAGAAWYRLFPASAPGYGFVDEATPEISTLAVVEDCRRLGVGRTLLEALIAAARADGFASLSLSVNRSNAEAVALYRSAGFTPREEVASSNDDSVTMLLDL
jgi:ribosomal protein S18 acetylase RimI-like enzyme